jgi:hypothetical protein
MKYVCISLRANTVNARRCRVTGTVVPVTRFGLGEFLQYTDEAATGRDAPYRALTGDARVRAG